MCHDYVTVVSDRASAKVLHVADGWTKESLSGYHESLTDEQKARTESVLMDMWPAYISATLEHIPGAGEKIAFDKFHVAKYLGEALDKVTRQEHQALLAHGREDLKGAKHIWLRNPWNMSARQWLDFKALRQSTLKTAHAWAIHPGVCHESLGLCEAWLGGERLEGVIILGHEGSFGAGQGSGQDHQRTPLGDSQYRFAESE
jgi:hypothetical protein